MRPSRSLLPALLVLALAPMGSLALTGCNADLATLNRATCADYATKAHKCIPGTSTTTFETSCALNLDTDADCRDCVVKNDCSTAVQSCTDACGKANPFAVKTATTGSTGTSGTSGTTSGGKGCSRFTVASLCDSLQGSSCGGTGVSCGTGYCPINSSCTTSTSCSCTSGLVAIRCDNGALCNGGCGGGSWWCHEQANPDCNTSLTWVGGTCACLDGTSIPVSCSGSNSSTCQQLCISAGH